MQSKVLEQTLERLLSGSRGILAADESQRTIEKRFRDVQLASTEQTRRDYREMLFTTPRLGEYISGVILFEETLLQNASSGKSMPQLLEEQGMLPGIKVDKGTSDLPGFPGETFTQGLDGLRERLISYHEAGARFAKWRGVLRIGPGQPSDTAIVENARSLALYAALCQEQGIVPIVEPEVLMEGAHDLQACTQATERTLLGVFHALHQQRVSLECMLLKPNMVVPGLESREQASAVQVAEATLRVLRHSVPSAVPGIFFLSGGQGAEEATERLNAINELARHAPWVLSSSFSRALQSPVLTHWAGRPENREEAQQILLARARLNSLARLGQYDPAQEQNLQNSA